MPNGRFSRKVAWAAAPSVNGRGKTGGCPPDKTAVVGQRRVPSCYGGDPTALWQHWVWPEGLKKMAVTYTGVRRLVEKTSVGMAG